jgi:hypothetical protein
MYTPRDIDELYMLWVPTLGSYYGTISHRHWDINDSHKVFRTYVCFRNENEAKLKQAQILEKQNLNTEVVRIFSREGNER